MNKRRLGQEQEALAANFLTKQGYRILEQNYRCRAGEIDLIGVHGEYLVFVEVKYRSSTKEGYAEEAVDFRKQKRICRAAQWYLTAHELDWNTPCRFDVAAVTKEEIHIYQNAFDFCNEKRKINR